MLAEERVSVEEDMISVALSVVIAELKDADSEGARSSTVGATCRVLVGKMNDSDDCEESGDFKDRLESCIVLSRMLSCAWGANCLDSLEWDDMKLLGCSNLRAWRSRSIGVANGCEQRLRLTLPGSGGTRAPG